MVAVLTMLAVLTYIKIGHAVAFKVLPIHYSLSSISLTTMFAVERVVLIEQRFNKRH
jgi:hypothetical protein